MTDDLDYHRLHWLLGKPTAPDRVTAEAEDFQVHEQLGLSPDGEGEYLPVHLRKTGYNTPDLAEARSATPGLKIVTPSPNSGFACTCPAKVIQTSRHFNSPAAISSPPPAIDVNCVSAPSRATPLP